MWIFHLKVPSINQLKQQQPFAMTMNQDPWAPVTNSTNTSQVRKDLRFKLSKKSKSIIN